MSKNKKESEIDRLQPQRYDIGNGMHIVRVGIEISTERLKVLEEISNIRGCGLRLYVQKAVHDQMDLDLETPNDLGLDYCRHLKSKLNDK